jgi:hypothetical protein
LSTLALAVFGIAVLTSLGLWLSMRVAGLAEVDLLPVRYRRRVRWWQGNERNVQFTCAALAFAAACLQIGVTVN